MGKCLVCVASAPATISAPLALQDCHDSSLENYCYYLDVQWFIYGDQTLQLDHDDDATTTKCLDVQNQGRLPTTLQIVGMQSGTRQSDGGC